ncbi:MAG: helix-turn-helix domain-containing protein [Butyrivibrio sp.]|nr:helix-turn-helix domain-containing protein [Acetatifactor muris]MCM1559181.1 helix-turn-helix domain-containing protein [Butyrivibrio sp.]
MTTGAILTRLRAEKDVGQKEVATYLKVSVSTVSNYENNVHSPDYTMLCRLADYYGVTTDYLLGRTDYRDDPKVLNLRVSEEYTITDVIDVMLTFDSATANHFMEYAKFLQNKPN